MRLLLALVLVLPCPPASAKEAGRSRRRDPLKGLVIGSIRVESHEIFENPTSRASRLFFGMANAVHNKTREVVIRRELLFAVGDPYDGNLLRETERNLRGLNFIRHASVTASRNSHGEVDVIVRTYDAWSLEVVASYKRVGGVTSTKAGLAEHNILGQGKELSATYFRDGRSQSETFVWKDPQFLNQSHLAYQTSYSAQPGSRGASMSIRRPFFASIARSSLGLTGNYSDGEVTTYSSAGLPNGAVRKQVGTAGLEYGVAMATSTERVRRITSGLVFRRANYGYSPNQGPDPRPVPEQGYFVNFGLEWTELDFVKEYEIQKFSHDEDYNLGFGISPSVSWAPPGLHKLNSQESQVLPRVVVSKGFNGDDELIQLRSVYSSTYINGSNGNRTLSGDVLYFRHGLPRQTVAVHASYDHGWRLDPSARLTLGESNGLRGYGLSQFMGDRRLLMNLEDRLFIRNEVFHVLDVGAVAFFDSGFVWPEKTPVRVRDLRNSVGVGLRLAPSRSAPNSPVRIDFARALSPNGTSSRWTVSILAGHAFGPE